MFSSPHLVTACRLDTGLNQRHWLSLELPLTWNTHHCSVWLTMTSLAPRFLLLFLFTFHTLQAPAFGAVKKLISFSWEDLRSSDQIRLTLKFQADSKPDALGFRWHDSYTAGVVVTYGNDPEQPDLGQVAMTLNRADEKRVELHLDVGQFFTHYVRIGGDVRMLKANGSVMLDMPVATILSGSELTYKPGEAVEVTIEDTFNTANSRFNDTNFLVVGNYIYEGEFYGKFYGINDPKVKEITSEKQNGVTTHKLKLRTDRYPINGVFRVQIGRFIYDDDVPFDLVGEVIWLEVHQDNIKGPFPDGTVGVYNSGMSRCPKTDPCLTVCSGYGNDLVSVKIYQKSWSGEKKFLPGGVMGAVTPAYQRTVVSEVDKATVPTTIVCEAQLKDGKKAVTQSKLMRYYIPIY